MSDDPVIVVADITPQPGRGARGAGSTARRPGAGPPDVVRLAALPDGDTELGRL